VPLQAGMVISNEPGYYADGKWGIRIENIIVVKIAETPNNFGERPCRFGMEWQSR
jgi:Xaa-Pro aminopeptidase